MPFPPFHFFLFIGIAFLIDKTGVFVKLLRIENNTISVSFRIALSLLSVGVFFILRSNFINPDGAAFAYKFQQDVPLLGAHVTHDEMWELYLHSRFWLYTNRYLGWSVESSYQILSCLAGGIFVFLLLTYCSKFFQDISLFAFLMCLSGGYTQLFFGDIENYTLTITWIMGYFFASALFVEKKVSIVVPSILLAIALTFHLQAGFLIPFLIFLYLIGWKRGEKGTLIYGMVNFSLIIAFTLLFFHFHGLPLSNLWYNSHAFGHGGHILSMLTKPSLPYYFDIFNLAFLLIPAWVFIVPLLIYNRISSDFINLHLFISACGMVALVLFWRAQLGVYNDWNLFAVAALPVSLIVWRNVLQVESLKSIFFSILGWMFFLHSFTWVIVNHFK